MTYSYDLKNNWPDSHNGYLTYNARQDPSYQETDIVGLLYRQTPADQPFRTLSTAAWKTMKHLAKNNFAHIMYTVNPVDLPLHARGEFEQMWNDARTKVLVKEAKGQQVNDPEPTDQPKEDAEEDEHASVVAADAVRTKAELQERLEVLREQKHELEEAQRRAKESVGRKRKHEEVEQWVDSVEDVNMAEQGSDDDDVKFLV